GHGMIARTWAHPALPPPEPAMARGRALAATAVALSMGGASAGLAVTLAGLEMKYLVAVAAALAGVVGLPLLGSLARIRLVMVMALALGLSVGLSISFFHRTILPQAYVVFAAGAEAVTVSLSFVACLGYLLAWFGERVLYGVRWPPRFHQPLVWPSVLFMVAGLFSLVNAYDAPLVLLEELRLAQLLLITLVAMNLRERELSLYLWTLGLSTGLQAGLAALQYATGHSLGLGVFGEANLVAMSIDYQKIPRPTGTLGDPNILSYFFEIAAPAMLALLLAARGGMERLFFGAATAAALAGLLVSLSRAAWMTVPLTFGFLLVTVYGRRAFTRRAAVIGIAILGALAVAAVFVYPLVARRLFGDDAGSIGHRLPLIRAALSVLAQFPVFGVGLNNFAVTFARYDTTGYALVFYEGDHVVHNLHLLVWTEVGTVGFLAYLACFLSAFIAAGRIGRQHPWRRAAALGIAAGLFAHLFHGMVDPGFKLSLTISQLIAAQLGIIGCLALGARQPNSFRGRSARPFPRPR
ncbi:MAG TPA: O-antigen ligase family protein, partial [Acetobacteraceae bacterium]